MTKDIRANIRTIATSDTARALAATAAGELIKKVATPGKKLDQPDGRVVASGIGGFAAGAGAATLATTAAKRIGKLVGRRRRPLFADVPKKAAKAVEVPKEAVDRFASGLRDQVSGTSKPSSTARRPAAKSRARTKSTARKASTSKSSGSGARTRAKATRSANGSSGKTTTRRSNGSSARKSGASKSSASGTRTRAKSTRSSNGSSGRSRAAASSRS
jgi:hypothetical protein